MNPGHYNRKVYWLVFAVGFAGFMGATLFYTSRQQRVYESAATLQYDPNTNHNGIRDFGDMVSIMKSPTLAHRVAGRLLKPPSPWNARDIPLNSDVFLRPYGSHANASWLAIEDLLLANRTVVAHPETNTAEIQYRHPDRLVAAKVANMFVDEYIAAHARRRIDEMMKEVEVLSSKAHRQDEKVKSLEQSLIAYRNTHADLSPEALQTDEAYQSLSKQLAIEQQVLKEIITHMRDMTMS